jgi:hypothetical protein
VEGRVGVVVVAGHAVAQLALLELAQRVADRRDHRLLQEDMRRHEDEPADRVAGGVDERDRSSVAVADEQGLGRVELREHRGQDIVGLLVEEGRRARRARRVRPAVAEAREGDHAPPGGLVQRSREVAPQADRAEPLVQEHHGAPRAVAPEVGDLDVEPVDRGHRRSA